MTRSRLNSNPSRRADSWGSCTLGISLDGTRMTAPAYVGCGASAYCAAIHLVSLVFAV
ncbi:hypothetical protein BJX64DRAFT_267379 [Aspergillus heterothallicus]